MMLYAYLGNSEAGHQISVVYYLLVLQREISVASDEVCVYICVYSWRVW